MKLRLLSTIVVALLGMVTRAPSLAQETPTAPKKVVLVEGTEVMLRMAQDVSSRAARRGEPIELTLAEDLRVGHVLVVKAGARALGEVVRVKRPDFWGEGGKISLRVRFLRVGDKKVAIRGATGAAGTRYVIIRGNQVVIKTGTLVKAFVAADVEVAALTEAPPTGK